MTPIGNYGSSWIPADIGGNPGLLCLIFRANVIPMAQKGFRRYSI
jgi:hypothetical protein